MNAPNTFNTVDLRYFTGTGNSLRILKTCQEEFEKYGYETQISDITKNKEFAEKYKMLGFCFPVYAFDIPRISRKYIKAMKAFKTPQKAFIILTAGGADEAGFAAQECQKLLKEKNCTVVYTKVIQMPVNWTTAPYPPFPPIKEVAIEIINEGVKEARKVVMDILAGERKFHAFNYPKRYTKFRFYKDYYGFKYMGVQHLWRNYKVYENCNGCGICEKACPTQSIKITNDKPIWSNGCEQCMRCVNICPKEAIYQVHGGETKSKNKYMEPGFKPLFKEKMNEVII